MNTISIHLDTYLSHCTLEKRLDTKTTRAYRCDLTQCADWLHSRGFKLSRESLKIYLAYLNSQYSPATTKRKIASIKAFCTWCEEESLEPSNPFRGLKIKMREPRKLPRTIKLDNLRAIANTASKQVTQYDEKDVSLQERELTLRNEAIVELLIATGIRISELCGLNVNSYDQSYKTLRIMGKGSRERVISIGAKRTQVALERYLNTRGTDNDVNWQETDSDQPLFLNRFGKRLSTQAARNIIKKLAKTSRITERITPHMFRHTFATLLLEQDVDIRYIQKILGHSSLRTTEIYTHVTSTKLEEILSAKNPRDLID